MEKWIIVFNANMREEKYLENLSPISSTWDIDDALRLSPIEAWSASHKLIMAGISHTLKQVSL